MVKRVSLDSCCEKKITTLQSSYDGLIDYIDISSVDNVEKKIISYQTVNAQDAPSRAKQLLKKDDARKRIVFSFATLSYSAFSASRATCTSANVMPSAN